MDRQIVYPGAIPLDTDILSIQRNTMVALGYLAQAVMGTGTVVDGMACTPTAPATLVVNVGQGSIIALSTIDATAFGSLASDSADPLVKMGINAVGSTLFTLAAPTTSGQSISYLIEATFQEADSSAVVLPYYNASNPAAPYSGPANSGTAQNTQRLQRAQLQLKAGTAATTGTQTTPAVDVGWVGLYVITVNYGQTQVTAANIVQHPQAPFIAAKLPQLRRKLFANLNLYVNGATGNDLNNGFATATAFATLQAAWNYVVSSLDLNGYAVTVNIANGSYAGLIATGAVVGNTQGTSGVQFVGNTGSPASVVVAGTNSPAVQAANDAVLSVAGITMSASGTYGGIAANALFATNAGIIAISGPVGFGATAGSHIWASTGAVITASGISYTISGGAASHLNASGAGVVTMNACAATLTGTPAFSTAFVSVSYGLVQDTGATFSGSATGTRYTATVCGAINTSGGGASYFPGSVAGGTSSGGQYV